MWKQCAVASGSWGTWQGRATAIEKRRRQTAFCRSCTLKGVTPGHGIVKIPNNAKTWTEVPPYGKVFLRKYSSFGMIKIYRCVQDAASNVIPRLLEYYHFLAPLDNDELMARLRLMGYPENLYVAGLDELSFANQTFVAVSVYGGQPLLPVAKRLKEVEQGDDLKRLMCSLGACFGSLHHAGLICGDTHFDQFVVDESLVVRRIDVHQTRVRMDIVSGHPIFGGVNESFFEDRRLTLLGFTVGVQNELKGPLVLARYLDKKMFYGDEFVQACRNGYLSAGGTEESWASAEDASEE